MAAMTKQKHVYMDRDRMGMSDVRVCLSELVAADPHSGAWFSPEPIPIYRYALWRRWTRGGPLLLVSMLNPSTADHRRDDPTIRRCIGFAKRDGFSGIIVLNAYAFRATKPRDMFAAADPDGPLNRAAKQEAAVIARDTSEGRAPVVMMAHGTHGGEGGRRTYDILQQAGCDIRALGVTNDGSPRHPLYVHGEAPMWPWAPAERRARTGEVSHLRRANDG